MNYLELRPAQAVIMAAEELQSSNWHSGIAGFAFLRGADGIASSWELRLPWWFVALVWGVLPGVWLFRTMSKRTRAGHCSSCSYDLTANASGVCPECGTKVGKGVA